MLRTILRLTSSMGLALCMGVAFIPLGCGGSNEWTVMPSRAVDEGPAVPPGTFSALMACVTEAKGRLTDRVYTVQFDVEMDESGEASRVRLRDSLPAEPALEACLGDALRGMALPMSLLQRRAKHKAVSPASREVMGQVWEEFLVAGAAVNLAPIFLTAAAVTVTVMVGVKATTAAIDAIRRGRKPVKKCTDMFVTCQDIRRVCAHEFLDSLDLCGVCNRDCLAGKPYTHRECYQCGFRDVP